jgi:uncharacterized zinc-type alcohol dehydrogenase-like protein
VWLVQRKECGCVGLSARHDIAPVTESFKMSEANEAFEHLEAGKARYRIVLESDIRD